MTNAWYGCRRDTRDARDHEFLPRAIRLPETVDLRQWCPPVMDQGALGSCTAHGITGAFRTIRAKAGLSPFPMSRLQLYYDERKAEGTIASDAGAEIRDGIKCLAKIGVAHEALWPYAISKFKTLPPAKAYDDAHKFEALTYQRVPVSASGIKQALASGSPVIIGVSLYDSFEDDAVAKTGIVPMPNLHKEKLVGGHCMYAVGYGQKPGMITVRNSWAGDWGDKGDCYFHEEYLGSTKFGSDYWVISQ